MKNWNFIPFRGSHNIPEPLIISLTFYEKCPVLNQKWSGSLKLLNGNVKIIMTKMFAKIDNEMENFSRE